MLYGLFYETLQYKLMNIKTKKKDKSGYTTGVYGLLH